MAAVVAGGQKAPYARVHEFGSAGLTRNPVWVPEYTRGFNPVTGTPKRVRGHFRRMNITAQHFLEKGVKHGDEYAKREVDKEFQRLQSKLSGN